MDTLFSLFGVVLLFLLILSGLLLIVAPAVGQRLLRKTATFAGLFFVLIIAFNLIWGFIRSIDSIAPILAFAVLSLVAYLVREHRIGAGLVPGAAGAVARRMALGVDADAAIDQAAQPRPPMLVQERAAAGRECDRGEPAGRPLRQGKAPTRLDLPRLDHSVTAYCEGLVDADTRFARD